MERGQTGKALETEVGDWIEIRSRNPNRRKESDRITKGFHFFDVVRGIGKAGQVLLLFHGSIALNTTVRKTGSDTDHG